VGSLSNDFDQLYHFLVISGCDECVRAVADVVCVRLTGCVGSSLLAVGIFAFNKLTWSWSVSAEVFGLNNLFAALLMSQAVDIDMVVPEQYHQVPKVYIT